MSFDIKSVYGYGTANIGDVEISDGLVDNVNSYARIVKIDELDDAKIEIDSDNALIGRYENFSAGVDVMIHISTSSTETSYLGKYMVAKVLFSQFGILTLDKPITSLIPREQFDFYNVQILTFARFDCLILKSGGVLSPRSFDPYKMCGGILAIKCFDKLTFEGGHINLSDFGIPANRKHLFRPLISQETAANGESDVSKFSGRENCMTAERFLLNAGDGAAFIVAKKLNGHNNSRIGNIDTHGARFCRGAANSVGVKPSNITNIGGSTILIAAEEILNFDAKMIAKYRTASDIDSEIGRGLARCYIASNTILPCDEGLYSFDVLTDTTRISKKLNIKHFGLGTYGSIENPTKALNNYARVISIGHGGHRVRISAETLSGLTPINEGSMVIGQIIQKSNLETTHSGDLILAKVLKREENILTLDFPMPDIDVDEYIAQIISLPQFIDFKLNQIYSGTPAFNGECGGIFAIMVNNLCDISDGKILVEGRGGAEAYGESGLSQIGNSQNVCKLPLGAGHGSVFIMSKKLKVNDNTRIGASYSGSGTNNRFGGTSDDGNIGGGYKGDDNTERLIGATGGGFIGGGSSASNFGIGGSGASGGTYNGLSLNRRKISGGYGSNGADSLNGKFKGGRQGAHLMIIADEIEGFNLSALSTGGEGGRGDVNGISGGASYGGGGSTGGSSGGSGGFCFIHCNKVN